MSKETALVVIDAQVGLMKDAYRPADVLQTIGLLLERARSSGTPVIYVQHNDGPGEGDLETGTPGWQIHPAVAPHTDEPVIQKASPDAFHRTNLLAELQARGIRRMVITGAQTECCVDATARQAVSQGYDVLLVSDAHTTLDSKTLTAAQIVAFFNEAMHGFWAGESVVRVRSAAEIVF